MSPEYESLDPAKACSLLEKWGPIGATLGCLVILAKELGMFSSNSRLSSDIEGFSSRRLLRSKAVS